MNEGIHHGGPVEPFYTPPSSNPSARCRKPCARVPACRWHPCAPRACPCTGMCRPGPSLPRSLKPQLLPHGAHFPHLDGGLLTPGERATRRSRCACLRRARRPSLSPLSLPAPDRPLSRAWDPTDVFVDAGSNLRDKRLLHAAALPDSALTPSPACSHPEDVLLQIDGVTGDHRPGCSPGNQ